MSTKALVKPEILKWARENAGFSIEEAAQKIHKKYESWEKGIEIPTIKQLKKISEKFKISLAVFYLQEVPPDFELVHDFRRIDINRKQEFSPKLRYEIRQARQRREQAIELSKDLHYEIKAFNYKININEDPEKAGEYLRNLLQINSTEQKSYKNHYDAFNNLRSKIEQLDILVFQIQNVEVDEMRGLSIFENIFPVIALNKKDTVTARIFSLMHEFTHLLLGQSGVSDMIDDGKWFSDEDKQIEMFCNRVAGATLVPVKELQTLVRENEKVSLDECTENISKYFNVSRQVILRRLLTYNYIDKKTYQNKQTQYRNEFLKFKLETKEKNKDKSFARNMVSEIVKSLGETYINLVLDNYYNKNITLNESSDLLGGIKIKYLKKITAGAF